MQYREFKGYAFEEKKFCILREANAKIKNLFANAVFARCYELEDLQDNKFDSPSRNMQLLRKLKS
jgi:hypothetical protein